MPDPQDTTDIEKMVAAGRTGGQPVKVRDLAAVIRKQFNPPADLSDGAVVKQFGAHNPSLGMDQLQYDLTGANPGAPATVQPAASSAPAQASPAAGSDDIWSAIRRGSIKGLATAEDFANNAAHIPADVLNRLLPSSWSRAMGMAPGSSDPGNVLEMARRGAQMEHAKAAQLPEPTGLPAQVAAAVPEAIGYAAPYLALGGGGVAADAEEGLPVVQRVGRAIGRAIRTQSPKMAAVEAIRAEQGGPQAMLQAGAAGAAAGGVGFPVAEETIGALPGMSRLPAVARKFASVAGPAAAMSGGTPEERAAQGIAYGLMAAPGGEAAKSEPKAKTAEVPKTELPPGAAEAKPAEAPAGPKLSANAQKIVDLATREAASNPKLKLQPGTIAKDLAIDGIEGSKVYAELRQAGKINTDGTWSRTTAAPPGATAAPVDPAQAARDARLAELQEQLAALRSAPAEPTAEPAGPAAPSPTASPAEAPVSTGRTEPPPAAPEPAVATPRPPWRHFLPAALPVTTPESAAAPPPQAATEAPPPAMPPGYETPRTQLPEPAAAPARMNREARRMLSVPPGTGFADTPRIMAERQAIIGKPPEEWSQSDITAADQLRAEGYSGAQTAEEAAHQERVQRLKAWQKAGERGSFSQKVPVRPEEIQPSVWTDLYNEGRYHLNKVGQNFDAWKDEMVKQFGDWVGAHLTPIWQQLTAAPEPPTVGATAPPPGAAPAPAGPSQPPPYLKWDTLRTETPPPQAEPQMPPGATDWRQWAGTVISQDKAAGLSSDEILAHIEKLRQAANEPHLTGPIVPARWPIALSEFNRQPGIEQPGSIDRASPASFTAPPPADRGASPGLSLASSPSVSGALQQALTDAGMAPLATSGTDALEAAGFKERQSVFTGSGPNQRLSPQVLRRLPSGDQASETWTKPVADGSVEIQRHGVSQEFTATKYYSDGQQRTVHGVGDEELAAYLKQMQARDQPLRPSQAAGRTGVGGVSHVTAAPPTAPAAAEPASGDIIADAVRRAGLAQTTGSAMTLEELQSIIAHAARRAIQPADPSETPAPPERVAQAVSQVTGGRPVSALDPTVSRIIADAVNRARVSQGMPAASAGPAAVRPVDRLPTAESPKPTQKRVALPADSPFEFDDTGANTWSVKPKDGGTTNVYISKSPRSKFFEVHIGNTVVAGGRTSTLTAAKLKALEVAQQQVDSVRGRGRPSKVQPPAVVVTPPQ